MMTAHIAPIFAAAGMSLFVLTFPQPEDFTQALTGRLQSQVSTTLNILHDTEATGAINAVLRQQPEGSAVDHLTDSGCIQEIQNASPNRLYECGSLIAAAVEQMDAARRDKLLDGAPEAVQVKIDQTSEYLRLAAANVCRAHWVLTNSATIDPAYPACTVLQN